MSRSLHVLLAASLVLANCDTLAQHHPDHISMTNTASNPLLSTSTPNTILTTFP